MYYPASVSPAPGFRKESFCQLPASLLFFFLNHLFFLFCFQQCPFVPCSSIFTITLPVMGVTTFLIKENSCKLGLPSGFYYKRMRLFLSLSFLVLKKCWNKEIIRFGFFVIESKRGPPHFTAERSDLVSMLNQSSTSSKQSQTIEPNCVW